MELYGLLRQSVPSMYCFPSTAGLDEFQLMILCYPPGGFNIVLLATSSIT